MDAEEVLDEPLSDARSLSSPSWRGFRFLLTTESEPGKGSEAIVDRMCWLTIVGQGEGDVIATITRATAARRVHLAGCVEGMYILSSCYVSLECFQLWCTHISRDDSGICVAGRGIEIFISFVLVCGDVLHCELRRGHECMPWHLSSWHPRVLSSLHLVG